MNDEKTENENNLSKEAQVLAVMSNHQNEFFAAVFTTMASIEARQQVNQNLLMTILSVQGFADDEIETLKKKNYEDYKEYKNTFSKIYARKLEEFKRNLPKAGAGL